MLTVDRSVLAVCCCKEATIVSLLLRHDCCNLEMQGQLYLRQLSHPRWRTGFLDDIRTPRFSATFTHLHLLPLLFFPLYQSLALYNMYTIPFVFGLAAAVSSVSAGKLGVGSTRATTRAAHALADKLMGYYSSADGGVIPGYNWWESGGMWATMIHYAQYTGDTSYNNDVASAISTQAGSTQDFMGDLTTGNDDQLWWGIAAITAAEYSFQAPSDGSSWLQMAENVFNAVQDRWDPTTCNGGLNWQIDPSAKGAHYKNGISNGFFFQLAARLARYTGHEKYATSASKTFDWVQSVNLIDKSTYRVYDGTNALQGCTSLNHIQWSYNVGVFLYGAAVMLDHTGDAATWQPHVDGFIGVAQASFTDKGVLQESKCEPNGDCNTDQLSFKAFLSRWLAQTSALVPSTHSQITPLLQASVDSAIASCNSDNTCGIRWPTAEYDGTQGVGQQMAALEIVQGQLAISATLPANASKRKVARSFQV